MILINSNSLILEYLASKFNDCYQIENNILAINLGYFLAIGNLAYELAIMNVFLQIYVLVRILPLTVTTWQYQYVPNIVIKYWYTCKDIKKDRQEYQNCIPWDNANIFWGGIHIYIMLSTEERSHHCPMHSNTCQHLFGNCAIPQEKGRCTFFFIRRL